MNRSIFAVILLTASLFAATASQSSPPASDVIIKQVEVTGNYEIPDDVILSAATSKTGAPLSTETLESDLQHIFDLGYFSKDVKVSLSEYDGGAKITFVVNENPVVSQVEFTGNASLAAADLLKSVTLRPGSVLNSKTLRADIESLERLYADRGYIAARVLDVGLDGGRAVFIISEGTIKTVKVEYITKNADIDPDSNEPLTSDDYIIATDGKTRPYVITREMKTVAGDSYNSNLIGADLQRIYNLGYFDDVRTRIEAADEPGNVIVIIQVEEGPMGSYGFSGGYSNSTGFAGGLTYSNRNLKGKGRRADVSFERGSRSNNYELTYVEPWLDRHRTSIETSLYKTSKEYDYSLTNSTDDPDYEELRSGFSITAGRPLSDNTRFYFGVKSERVNVEPHAYDYLDGTSRSLTTTLRTDTRDNVFNPGKGRYDSASLRLNGGLLGGSFDYQKLTLDFRRFRRLAKKQSLAFHASAGFAWNDIPRVDYFELGGANSIRGYEEDAFEGNKMVLYNAEYRVSLSGNLGVVAFADAGHAWGKNDKLDLSPLKYEKSIGAGIRLKIPQLGTGPVRLDYAYALSNRDTNFHFGFGHLF